MSSSTRAPPTPTTRPAGGTPSGSTTPPRPPDVAPGRGARPVGDPGQPGPVPRRGLSPLRGLALLPVLKLPEQLIDIVPESAPRLALVVGEPGQRLRVAEGSEVRVLVPVLDRL